LMEVDDCSWYKLEVNVWTVELSNIGG
jgi:hypothetical protein